MEITVNFCITFVLYSLFALLIAHTHTNMYISVGNGNTKVPKYLLDAVNCNCSRFIRYQHAASSTVCQPLYQLVSQSVSYSGRQPNALVSVAFQNWLTAFSYCQLEKGKRRQLELAI